MSKGVFYYSDAFQSYDMGPQHPLKPIRLRRTWELLREYGALEAVRVEEPSPCTTADLIPAHSPEFVEAVRAVNEGPSPSGRHVRFGLGFGDNPLFPGIWDASCLYTGASLDAAQAVVDGAPVAMNISGGLHHAHYDRAAGFCVFNDCVVAIHRLRSRFQRVAYVDIDVHHGDGVQEAFYSDPTVLTLSIHETGQTLYPGTGFVGELGVREGHGYSVNVPLWPYTNDAIWVGAWRRAALPILQAFRPQAVVVQLGADPHFLDPLAHLFLTAQGWLEAVVDVHALGVPVVALGGGGYCPTTVPRMWALAFSELFGVDLPDATPPTFSYHDHIPVLRDHELPELEPHDLERAAHYAERTVREVREHLFPLHGLDA